VTAVGLSTAAGGAVHVVLTLFALAWAGTAGLGGVSLPDPRTLLITGGIVLGIVGLGVAIPVSRHFVADKAAAPLKQSLRSVAELSHQPKKLVMLFGGSALVTGANLLALVAALRAFGVSPAISTVAVVYLAGSAIAAAAPTPSGLGANEAALVAGLVATEVTQSSAVAAVLVFRLATFWLPILPGWLAFVMLQRRGRI
jgi:glycosyltransferase 2 family protein